MYHDFAAIKAAVSFGQVVSMLNLNVKQHNNQWRGPCSACNSGGERALVITEGKGFYCFASKKGGDQIALVAHIRDIPVKDAAEQLARHAGTVPERKGTSTREPGTVPVREGCPVLSYLEPADARVQALGVTEETAKEWGERLRSQRCPARHLRRPREGRERQALGLRRHRRCFRPGTVQVFLRL